MDNDQLVNLPAGLAEPEDDGAAAHLHGLQLPILRLPTTAGNVIDLGLVGESRMVLYLYPMTGRPGVALPDQWDLIPGARGCTPEACGFHDHATDMAQAGASVYGLSSQPSDYQQEVADRLRLPFALISDQGFELDAALNLPTFNVEGMRFYKRLTMVVFRGVIEHVFYPVFPPDQHANRVLSWLRENPQS